jgi:hypothetical protein
MPRQSNPERIEKLKQKAARIEQELRRALAAEKKQAEQTRVHCGIVIGLGMIEHANKNPDSEVRRVAIRIAQNWIATRPKERDAFAPLLAAWGAPLPDTEPVPAATSEAAE